MTTLLFVSDLHLSDDYPSPLLRLQTYLGRINYVVDAIYFLGDIFDFWVGDDTPFDIATQFSDYLRSLDDRGIALYLMCGNRDFLLGKKYAKTCAAQLLPDPYVIEHKERRILLSHGDRYCTDDVAYQKYRKYVHNPLLQAAFLCLPLAIRMKIATKIRKKSMGGQVGVGSTKVDLNEAAVLADMRHYHCHTMIHGHTHKPYHHAIPNTPNSDRIVLGDWRPNEATVLLWKDYQKSLEII